jgi:hypothetical protein
MFTTALRAAAALAMIGAVTTVVATAALGQRIPPSEMPGRERERFTDPLPPVRAQPGPMFSPPGTIYAPHGTKSRAHKAHASRKQK